MRRRETEELFGSERLVGLLESEEKGGDRRLRKAGEIGGDRNTGEEGGDEENAVEEDTCFSELGAVGGKRSSG